MCTSTGSNAHPFPALSPCTWTAKYISRYVRFAEENQVSSLKQEIAPSHPPRLTDNHRGSTLSSHALDALKQFYTERDTHAERFEKLKTNAEHIAQSEEPLSMEAFTEDWNESQFWVSWRSLEFRPVKAHSLLLSVDHLHHPKTKLYSTLTRQQYSWPSNCWRTPTRTRS